MRLLIASIAIFLVSCSLTFAQILASTTFSQSFKDRVLFSPEIAFVWNFQRGVEELYRLVKFTTLMRVGYSLELGERRIGEMELLINKNETDAVPVIENEYEVEIDKIQVEIGSTDILSKIMTPLDVRKNVTERLDYDIKVLNTISSNATEPTKNYITNAIKKTSDCVDFIKRLQ